MRAFHPDRISDDYADSRIRAEIRRLEDPRSQRGLVRLSRDLKAARIPAAARLHLVAAVAQLGRVAATTRSSRIRRASGAPNP